MNRNDAVFWSILVICVALCICCGIKFSRDVDIERAQQGYVHEHFNGWRKVQPPVPE